ncbi:MAG TPA: FAD-dependent oxidoreductase, partial [Saprospiraceae bacterium]|nr:FAD-dependent oxidoreductase [Saprospiraceae bacterium]
MAQTSDLVIVGSGIAGLSLAIQVAQRRKDLKITVLAKTTEKESNTNFAQGGIATVWDVEVDNFEKHIADTLDAGDGLCDKEVVEIVVKSAPERVRELIDWGANFDKTQTGEYDLGREGGHTENRILHYKDITGREIQRTVVEKAAQFDNIEILEHYFAIDIITQHHLGYNVSRLTPNIECYGVYALDRKTNEIKTFLAR